MQPIRPGGGGRGSGHFRPRRLPTRYPPHDCSVSLHYSASVKAGRPQEWKHPPKPALLTQHSFCRDQELLQQLAREASLVDELPRVEQEEEVWLQTSTSIPVLRTRADLSYMLATNPASHFELGVQFSPILDPTGIVFDDVHACAVMHLSFLQMCLSFARSSCQRPSLMDNRHRRGR